MTKFENDTRIRTENVILSYADSRITLSKNTYRVLLDATIVRDTDIVKMSVGEKRDAYGVQEITTFMTVQ